MNKKYSNADNKQSGGIFLRKPQWLKMKLPSGEKVKRVGEMTTNLVTVCEEAMCPNRYDCWSGGTATFMLLGDICTRKCRFCSVKAGRPNSRLDREEPSKLANAVKILKLKYVVLTSVTRDDLPDGGSSHIAACIKAIKSIDPEIIIEVLIPDFKGKIGALSRIIKSPVEVIAHNVETVERLTKKVRDPRASYHQSLQILEKIKRLDSAKYTKSSIMVGVGETWDDLHKTFQDLHDIDLDFLTIGQYLRPTRKQIPVEKYIHPDIFNLLQIECAKKYGFKYVVSGPLVRSSYKAGELFIANKIRQDKSLKPYSLVKFNSLH
ncbi:MAG: lipoyl synthase [Candidatus Hodarchaeales archaeon]|jgi:lipoic acid synthetase